MRYRSARVLALLLVLTLGLAPLARAGQSSIRRSTAASAQRSMPANSLSTLLGLVRALWLGDGYHDDGDHHHHGHEDPPEGSGLCPHGQH